VLDCLWEEIESDDDVEVTSESLDLAKHIRERRNRKGSYIRELLKVWQKQNEPISANGQE